MAWEDQASATHVRRDALDALHDGAIVVNQDEVGVPANQLDHQVDEAKIDLLIFFLGNLIIEVRGAEVWRRPGLLIRVENTLGYTDAHQPLQRRLVDAGDDASAHIFAQEEPERRYQCRVQRRHAVCEPQPGECIVCAGQQMMPPATSVDFSANGALVNEADALDTSIADGGVEFIDHRSDGQEIVGIWHE